MIKNSVFAGLALASTAAFAQGSFDFTRVPGLAAEPTVQIDIPAQMIGFLTQAMDESDPGAARVLEGIRSVRVLVYEDLEETAPVLETIEEATRMLEREGWQRMVYINEGDEKVRLYVRLDGQDLAGMTVMVLDGGDEAVFVNVDGTISPATLGQLANGFGMGGMLDDITGLGHTMPGAAPGGSGSDPE